MSETIEPQTGTALETIETTNLVSVFTSPGGIEAILTRIEADARARAEKLDVTTVKGRTAIASLARSKVASAKTQIIAAGKKLTEEWREQTKAVNADCKLVETRLDALRDEVRAPLTKYEDAEKNRIGAHEAALADILALTVWTPEANPTAEQINERIWAVPEVDARQWQEFDTRAAQAIEFALTTLHAAHETALTKEAEAAEHAKQQVYEAARIAAENERNRIEHERQIAENARAVAIMEAEQKAERERQDAARAVAEAEERAAAAAREAEAAKERERIAAERAEINRKAEAERAKRDQEAAVERERQRAAAFQAEEQRKDDERAKNVAHRRSVNRAVYDALIKIGLDTDTAKLVMTALASGSIARCSVNY